MPAASETLRARPRDPRLDFFRGLGMFIIMIAHIPWSGWTEWLPSRFGFSDGADMFVFCSGMASAIAFARVFDHAGWLLGTARIAYRAWQVYWAHIGSFIAVTAFMLAADAWFGADHYAREELALGDFLAMPGFYLPHLMTLTYVPNYFDILPMYMVILCMIPFVMALARAHPAIAMAASAALWLAANLGGPELMADPVTGRTWFFNPFAWQLIFFTGFAFARGWLPAPPRDGRLTLAAVAVILLAAPVSCQDGFQCYAGFGHVPALGQFHEWLGPLIGKHNLGFLRYVHFLATAYIAFVLAGEGGRNLMGGVADLMRRVGQQTLAVFLTGLIVAQAMGMLMDMQGGRVSDLAGRSVLMTAFVNLLGMALLVLAALIVGWFKSAPWRHVRQNTGEAAAPVASPRAF
jgi:hypothetical protein